VSSELRWAVTDGPAGTHAVELPADPAGARLVVTHYRGRFWCSRRAGGCGERLLAGADGFRHADAAAWCRFAEADAGPAYEHLRYEPALTAWLTELGFFPRPRTLQAPDGAVDLQIVVDEVDAVLEVQLAPLSDVAWRERDDADRARHRHVTWLYGPGADEAAATEAAVRGLALGLRRQNRGLIVGVRDVDDRVRWVPLTACRLTPDGFEAPGVEQARAVHRRRTTERRAAARRVTRHAPPPEQLAFPV
jgi:hypothetical protein